MLSTQERLRDRHGRSSRDSTPRAGGNTTNNNTATSTGKKDTSKDTPPAPPASGSTQEKRTFLDRWVEPPVLSKPSYKDHGGNGYGVSEHLQPLGELPNARARARFKTLEATGTRKAAKTAGGVSAVGGGSDARDTPDEFTASPAPGEMAVTGGGGASAARDSYDDGAMDGAGDVAAAAAARSHDVDDDDDDYRPSGSKSASAKKQARVKRPRNVKTKSTTDSSRAARTGEAEAGSKADKESRQAIVNKNRRYNATKLKEVVEAAKARAVNQGKPDLAAAVNEIYEESLYSVHLTELLEGILSQEATTKEKEQFQVYVRKAKRKLKHQAEGRGKPAPSSSSAAGATTNGATSLPHHSSAAKAAFTPAHKAIPSTENTDSGKPRISLKVKSGGKKMSVSPRKRNGSVDSDSSLTSMTSNEEDDSSSDDDDDDMEVDRPSAPPAQKLSSSSTAARPAKTLATTSRNGSLAPPAAARGTKRSSAEADLQDERERDRVMAAKKQKLSAQVHRDQYVSMEQYEESHVREPPRPPAPVPPRHTSPQRRAGTTTTTTQASATDTPARRTRAAHQANRAASQGPDSVLSSPPTPIRSQFGSGGAKTFGRKAKIKQSPEKKNNINSTAGYSGLSGIGGAGLRGSSPIGGEDNNEESSENNDFCSACGGSGFLLCCDGCDRSFHFSCLDPPLSENASELNEPWFCFTCVAKRPVSAEQLEKPPRGLFAALHLNLRKRNPANFSLPPEIRDYFEGVTTDKDGQFIEAVNNRPTRNRTGWDETPDYTKLKDGKGNLILCYSCGKSSQGSRPIILCDYCGQNWHLDCLDPPLANPPARGLDGKKVHDWMCPLHADQELRRLDTSLLYPRRRVHIRKPRNARIVETSLRRGFVNNGVIEVVDDSSDESDSEFFEEEMQDEGVVYRLPASGIKLDFIDKVKHARIQDLAAQRAAKRMRFSAVPEAADAAPPNQLQQANFAKRSFREKQTALNLAQFANANQDIDLGGDQVASLVGTLIAEAPTEVVNEVMLDEETADALAKSSAIPPSPPASEQTDQLSATQRKQLQLLQELIRRRLESSKT